MDIKQAIREVAWTSRMATAASDGDVFKKAIRNLRIRKQLESIDAWADMAEAALAYAEYQYDTDHGELVEMGDYMSRRGQLWHRFVKAREKAMT